MGFGCLLATSAVLIVLRPVFTEINCENDVHENCPSIALFNTISDSDGFFSENMLIERCSDILEDISCKDNYLDACDHENYKIFSLMTNGLKDVFSELCNETSDLRMGYRQHIACFKRSSSQFRNCLLLSLEAVRRYQQKSAKNEAKSEEEQIKALCMYQESFRTCTVDAVRTTCGDEASIYLATLYSRGIQDLVSQVC